MLLPQVCCMKKKKRLERGYSARVQNEVTYGALGHAGEVLSRSGGSDGAEGDESRLHFDDWLGFPWKN
jgi:hypothetical protein